MDISATRCQGNVREFQSVWRVVTLQYERSRDHSQSATRSRIRGHSTGLSDLQRRLVSLLF